MARLKQRLHEALNMASAHRFLWRHELGPASMKRRECGFPGRSLEALEFVRWPRLIPRRMAKDEDFEPRLGRTRKRGKGDRFATRIIRAANLAGGIRLGMSLARNRFHGARIGRGAGVGRVLSAGGASAVRHARRVVVKASIVRLGARGLSRATAHMRYLQRDGTTREGERGGLYSGREDVADGKAFVERGAGDRHQFRFIVAPEDGSEYEDLKPLVRRLMEQAERDLGTKLDWVAVDHFNTGNPHSHVLVRGKDETGKDLVIARNYLTRGLRERAVELVNLDLGPRTELELRRTREREVEQERFTGIDRRLVASVGPDGLLDPRVRDRGEQDLRIARLRYLAGMELAREEGGGRWSFDGRLEETLRTMGMRGDIIRTMHRELGAAGEARSPRDQAIYDPGQQEAGRLVGRLVATGLSDEHADRRFLILDAVDGRTHYVDVGAAEIDGRRGAILSVMPRRPRVREVDRTVAAIAAASGGRYSVDLHLAHDRTATERFAEAHERRLEALRRAGVGPARGLNGIWAIPGDHLERVAAYEERAVARRPVDVAILSERRLDLLSRHDGVTWLDRELVAPEPLALEGGFGAEVRNARTLRLQWLAAQQLAEVDGGACRCRPDLIAALERRDLHNVAARLAHESGRRFVEHKAGELVEGTCHGPVRAGDRDFAVVQKSKEFTLVPWRPVLEQRIGRQVSGIVRDSGISWTFGRERGGPQIGM
jgi:type IV secretory pathway VirD2 relaxase